MIHRLCRIGGKLAAGILLLGAALGAESPDLQVNDQEYLDAQGLSVLLYHNRFHPVFVDEKKSAFEIILHGERIATDGGFNLESLPSPYFGKSFIMDSASGAIPRHPYGMAQDPQGNDQAQPLASGKSLTLALLRLGRC